jgi:hypothetical protein
MLLFLCVAFVICAVVVDARATLSGSLLGFRNSLRRGRFAHEIYPPAKLGDMQRSVWECVVIFCPSPHEEKYLLIFDEFHHLFRNSQHLSSDSAFWTCEEGRGHVWRSLLPHIWENKIVRQVRGRVILPTGMDCQSPSRSGPAVTPHGSDLNIREICCIGDENWLERWVRVHKCPLDRIKGLSIDIVRLSHFGEHAVRLLELHPSL